MTPEERFQKIEKGIVDLTGAARLTLDATQTLMNAVQTLADFAKSIADSTQTLKQTLEDYATAAEARSKEQDARMDALIHTVDDLVRDRWRRKNNGETEN